MINSVSARLFEVGIQEKSDLML